MIQTFLNGEKFSLFENFLASKIIVICHWYHVPVRWLMHVVGTYGLIFYSTLDWPFILGLFYSDEIFYVINKWVVLAMSPFLLFNLQTSPKSDPIYLALRLLANTTQTPPAILGFKLTLLNFELDLG